MLTEREHVGEEMFGLRIPVALKRELIAAAREDERSASAEARHAITDWLRRRRTESANGSSTGSQMY